MAQFAVKYVEEPQVVTATLLSTYVLSGCDTVSYPYRRGKRRAAKVALGMLSKLPHICSISDISGPVNRDDPLVHEARFYFIALYGHTPEDFPNLDILRQHMFATSTSDIRVLPPTDDAFYFHVLRSLYQIYLYMMASKDSTTILSPVDFGRTIQTRKLVTIMISKPSKPDLERFVYCKCGI